MSQLRRFLADRYSRIKTSIEQRKVTVISEYGRVGVQPLNGDSNSKLSASTANIDSISGVDLSSDREGTRLELRLTTGLWLPIFALLLLTGTISGIYFDNPAIVEYSGFAALGIIVFIIWAAGSLMRRTVPEGTELAQYREQIHPIFFLFLASVAISFISIASQLSWGRYLLSLLVFLGGSYIYAIQNTSPSNKGERFRYKLASAWWIPEALIISAILALTEIQSGIRSVPEFGLAVLIIFLIFTLALTRVWLQIVADRVQRIQNKTIKAIYAENTRRLWFFVQSSITTILAIMIVLVCCGVLNYIGVVSTDPLQLGETLRILEEILSVIPVGDPSAWLMLYVGLLFIPVITLFLIWGHQIMTEWRFRRMLFSNATRVSSGSLGGDSKYPVYTADLSAPTALAVPVWHQATTVVVIDRTLVDRLNEKQLQVIYRHEEYHISHHHGWVLDLLLIIAPIAGAGTTIAYWFPRVAETRADKYAADMVGHNTVVSTLQRVAELSEQRDSTDSSSIDHPILKRIFSEQLASDIKQTQIILFGFVYSGTLNESVTYRLQSLAMLSSAS